MSPLRTFFQVIFYFLFASISKSERNLQSLAIFEVERITDLDAVVRDKQPFLIRNPSTDLFFFVSNDEIKRDNIVEAHRFQHETRNMFQLESAGTGRYRFFNVEYKRWLFVARERKYLHFDYVLEAHPHFAESRNEFRLQPAPNQSPGHYIIVHNQSGLSLMVSKHQNGVDFIIEAQMMNPNEVGTDVEPFIFVLEGVTGLMGSRNDLPEDYAHGGKGWNWTFWIVVLLVIAVFAAVLTKMYCDENQRKLY